MAIAKPIIPQYPAEKQPTTAGFEGKDYVVTNTDRTKANDIAQAIVLKANTTMEAKRAAIEKSSADNYAAGYGRVGGAQGGPGRAADKAKSPDNPFGVDLGQPTTKTQK